MMVDMVVDITPQQLEEIESSLEAFDHAHIGYTLSGQVNLGIMDGKRLVAGASGCMTAFRIFYISTVFVDGEYRNRGMGRALMAAMESRAALLGATLIRLDTFSWQGEAFYQKLGYEQVGRYESVEDGFSESFFLKRLNKGV